MFIALASIGSAFALAQPPYGVSDEPAHTVKALAISSFQLSGTEVEGQFGFPAKEYRVPLAFSSIWHMTCYSSDTNQTPACTSPFPDDPNLGPVSTTAHAYPPVYYFIVGGLGWLWRGYAGLIAMRIASVLLWSITAALAFRILYRLSTIGAAVSAVFVACTPTMIAMGATVNPFSWESSLYLLMWSAVFTELHPTLKQRAPSNTTKLLWGASILTGLIRPVSFLWTATLLVAFYLIKFLINRHQRGRMRIFQDTSKSVLSPLLTSISISYAWQWWTATQGGHGRVGGDLGSLRANLRYSFDRLDEYLRQLHGFFGWTEFYAPLLSFVLWLLACSSIVLWAKGVRNFTPLALTSLIAIYLAPLMLEGARASSAGFGYQGRYLLPIVVGIPVVAIYLSALHQTMPSKGSGVALVALASTLISTIHLVRRYTVGLSGPYRWYSSLTWEPFGGPYLYLGLGMLGFTLALFVIFSANSSQQQSQTTS